MSEGYPSPPKARFRLAVLPVVALGLALGGVIHLLPGCCVGGSQGAEAGARGGEGDPGVVVFLNSDHAPPVIGQPGGAGATTGGVEAEGVAWLPHCKSATSNRAEDFPPLSVARRGLKDPFSLNGRLQLSAGKSLFNLQGPGSDDWKSRIEPLTRYPLDQYVLVGAITGVKKPRALLVDPDGGGHVVKVGQLIGKEKARVVSVRGDAMVVQYGTSSVLGSRTGRRTFRLQKK